MYTNTEDYVTELTAYATLKTGRGDLVAVPDETGALLRWDLSAEGDDDRIRFVVRFVTAEGTQLDATVAEADGTNPSPVGRTFSVETVDLEVDYVPKAWVEEMTPTSEPKRSWLSRLLGR